MYERLLDHLVCPACDSRFELEAEAAESSDGDREIRDGLLRCGGGDHQYPIVRGIPRLLPDAFEIFAREVQQFALDGASPETREISRSAVAEGGSSRAYDRRTGESFINELKHHEVGDRTWGIDLDERVDTYFAQGVGIPREGLDGKLMVDAGWGNGSQSVAYTAFGLEVIAIDLSSGLEHGHDLRHHYPGARPDRVHFVQADLQQAPLAAGSVDLIHSAGVLQLRSVMTRSAKARGSVLWNSPGLRTCHEHPGC